MAKFFAPKDKLVINSTHHLAIFTTNLPNFPALLDNVKDKRWNWIHVADLADAYVRAAKITHAIKGEAFNIVSDSSPTYEQLAIATARISGYKGM